MITVINYFLLFMLYAMIGWVLEIFYTLYKDKKFVNRGFLIGPYCPIYGIGCILIILLLSDFKSSPIALFVLASVICAVLEYFTSFIMEKLFHARWWDYSNDKFNINGRVTLITLIPFGIFASFIIYFVNPVFISGLNNIPIVVRTFFFLVFAFLFIIDNIVSYSVISSFRKTIKEINPESIAKDITEDVNKYIKKLVKEKSILHKRLINSFPKLDKIRLK